MARIWRRYGNGEEVSGAHLRVLRLTEDEPEKKKTFYLIQFLPCRCKAELSHTQIEHRIRQKTTKCPACKPVNRSDRPSKLDQAFDKAWPRWPVPPAVLVSVMPGWRWS